MPDEPCDIGYCECQDSRVKCELKDCNDVALQFSGIFNTNRTIYAADCRPEVHARYRSLYVSTTELYVQEALFSLRNCMSSATSLQMMEINFNGEVINDKPTAADEVSFQNSHNIWSLVDSTDSNASTVAAREGDKIPAQLSVHLDGLEYLDLNMRCARGVVLVPVNIFHTLDALSMLTLHFGAEQVVYNLTAELFRDLKILKTLNLDDNHMRVLAADTFMYVTNLQYLNLSSNELCTLPAELFSAQEKLLTLDLSRNQLETLPPGLFKRTEFLNVLLLSHNRMAVPSVIIAFTQPLAYLSLLDLSYNHLSGLHGTGAFENFTILSPSYPASSSYEPLMRFNNLNVVINLSHNYISRLSLDWFKHADYCHYIYDLSFNNITHVPYLQLFWKSMRQCPRSWILAGNPLYCDCQLAWLTWRDHHFNVTDWQCAAPAQLHNQAPHLLNSSALCQWSTAKCPQECVCIYNDDALNINCTAAQLVEAPTLPHAAQVGANSTTLYISHNKLYELPLNTTSGYASVSSLYAAHNQLSTIRVIRLPYNLRVLDVRANRLDRLSRDFLISYMQTRVTLQQLYISENPWLCDCEAELLLNIIRAQRHRIPDAHAAFCANMPNVSLTNVKFAEICVIKRSSSVLLKLALALTLLSTALISVTALYYKYKLQIKVWLYAHRIFLCCITDASLDEDKMFDAFISYSHQQQEYVNNTLLPQLEQGVPRFRICTHERNWLAGGYIPEQIIESVEQSRRTIIVLSQDFIASDWARMEFRMAHQSALNERRARIIIIKYGELTDIRNMDKELQAYLKMNTYLEHNDPRFWQKLRYAMPHKNINERKKSNRAEVNRRVNLIPLE
ncbi:protein toll-like [Ceratitis capitata]|uniref:protein toll-like n=1 Tax=Ceratitis capitata TaxID=7213 RepID=UPI000329B551|nr:protein toll-like [Ceratitis capitata]